MQTIEFLRQDLPYEINEEMKVLRTNLQFCGTDKRVILLTSAFSGEGKSTISLCLCKSLSELGKSVLLIDADMRNSDLLLYIKGEKPPFGLSHYLSGQRELKEVVYSTSNPGFQVVFSGAVPPNPSELLSAKRMQRLIELGKKNFDYVIIDCSPLGLVVDAAVIAPHCDGIILLIEAGEVKYRLAQGVTESLKKTGCPLLGVVLNKVDRKKAGQYGKYGKYGKYSKYGKYGNVYGENAPLGDD